MFNLQSPFNGQVLSVNGTAVVTAPQGESSLIQLFVLEAATT